MYIKKSMHIIFVDSKEFISIIFIKIKTLC